GWKDGINHHLEVLLGRELHWFVCMLHLIELVLKNLLKEFLDGSKYIGYNSELGQLITEDTLHERRIVEFETIDVNDFPDFSPIDRKGLGVAKDHDRFYRTCQALIHGDEESIKAVEGYRLGKIGHARWHTTIDRIC